MPTTMSTVPSSLVLSHPPGDSVVARVLLLRSCRPHVLDRAIRAVRATWPAVTITALSHAGHARALEAQGADETIEVPGRRFGVLSTPWETLRAIRAARYHAVIVPQMVATGFGHTNLYQLALATSAPAVAIFDPDHGLRWHSRRELLREVVRHWPAGLRQWLDVPLALCLMALAAVWPRPRPRPLSPRSRRVLHIITSWGVGGAQRQVAELVRHCPPDMHVDIFVLARSDGDFSTRHLRGHEVRIRYAKEWPMLAKTIREIAALCQAEEYDIVHTWLFLANALGVAGARLARVPRIVSSVRNLSLWKRTWTSRRWYRLADILSARASDAVTVNAGALVADHAAWARVSPERIVVVPNGLAVDSCDIDQRVARSRLCASLNLDAGVRLVGTVGRMAPEKDHPLLLDAWALVQRRVPDAHLVIVGDGPLRPAIDARVQAEGLRVSLLPEDAGARDIMAGLDVFVLPSRIEGFANVLLEATMLGIPVLATDVGAARDVIVDDADLSPVGDFAALAERLAAHLANLAGPRARAARRQIHVRHTFTVDRMVERWLTLYAGADR